MLWSFLTDNFTWFVVSLCLVFLSASTASVGVWAVLQKRALISEVIAHAVLPGVVLAFLIGEAKNPAYLLLGGFITGSFAVYFSDLLIRKTKLKIDTALGSVLAWLFGVGVLLLSYSQNLQHLDKSGLERFLWGKAASLQSFDLYTLLGLSILLSLLQLVLYMPFQILILDKDYAKTRGLKVKALQMLLSAMSVLCVVLGLQAVGVVLMAAFMITPAVVAQKLWQKLWQIQWFSIFLSSTSALCGTAFSAIFPDVPTGASIVLVMSILGLLFFIFMPQRGYLAQVLKNKAHRRKTTQENTLKVLYQLGEEKDNFLLPQSIDKIIEKRFYPAKTLYKTLKILEHQHFILRTNDNIWLTDLGLGESKRIVKAHRLWEQYLYEKLQFRNDHVHGMAEQVEHLLTPKLLSEIDKELKNPDTDPHNEPIPKL